MNNTNNNTDNTDSPQWDVVYQYTRSQAIADGFQIEATKTAQEADIANNHCTATHNYAKQRKEIHAKVFQIPKLGHRKFAI